MNKTETTTTKTITRIMLLNNVHIWHKLDEENNHEILHPRCWFSQINSQLLSLHSKNGWTALFYTQPEDSGNNAIKHVQGMSYDDDDDDIT